MNNWKRELHTQTNTLEPLQLLQCQFMLSRNTQFFVRRPTHLYLLYQSLTLLTLLCLRVINKSLVTSSQAFHHYIPSGPGHNHQTVITHITRSMATRGRFHCNRSCTKNQYRTHSASLCISYPRQLSSTTLGPSFPHIHDSLLTRISPIVTDLSA